MEKEHSTKLASEHVILLFEVDKLPQRDGDEQEWADAVLSCLRHSQPQDLPDGVKVMPDFKHNITIPLVAGCTCHERDMQK